MTPSERERRMRETASWTICEDTGQQAINGTCPSHHGDACLIVVGWVDNSHVRRDLAETQAKLWAAEAVARDFRAALKRIAEQEAYVCLGDPPWKHWRTLAREALASLSGEKGTEG